MDNSELHRRLLLPDTVASKTNQKQAEQIVTHQPAISFSISVQHPFNRAGGRTFNVVRRAKQGASYQVKDLLFQNLAVRGIR